MKHSNEHTQTTSNNKSNNVISTPFSIEGLYVDPSQNILVENNQARNVQPKVIEVLTYLCNKAEQIVSADELIKACWPNQYISDGPVHKCIAQLRKALADDPKKPRFIKTVPKKGYVCIAKVKGLKSASHIPRTLWSGDTPYPGLHPYTFEQSEVFFGREQIITEIDNWIAQITETDTSWLSLSAPVGEGKSSLVYAGILPTLIPHAFIATKQTMFCSVLDLTSLSTSPSTSQKPHIQLLDLLLKDAHLSSALTHTQYADLLTTQINNSTDNEQAEILQSHILTDKEQGRFVLFIDHLEQLFDCYSPLHLNEHDLARFFLLLHWLVASKKCVLITATRVQFLDELAALSIDYDQAFQYEIPAFSHTELIDIIHKPAELAGVSYEYNEESRERLSSEIIQQLQKKSVPISSLQYLLAQLYAQKFNQLITYKAYRKIGGIAGSLATIAEQTLQQLTEQEQTSFDLVLFRIITLNTNGKIATTEQPCPINHFIDKNKLSVINKFINVGIFQLLVINEQTCVYLAHESLLTAWPRISLWVNKNISILYVRHDLHIATQRWLYNEKSNHLLIHSNQKIKHLNNILRCNDFDISPHEQVLIALSTKKLTRTNRITKALYTTFFISFISLVGLTFSLVEKNKQIATTRDNAENLISFILYDLKDKLEPLGKIDLLNIVADKTVDYFTLAGTEHLSGKSLIQWVEALHILGDVNISKNNYSEAEAYFTQTLSALNHALTKTPTDEKLLELTMLANYWLGYSAYLQLDYKTTLPFWEQYLTYADTLYLHYPKEKWQLEQSYALNNLGALAEKTSDLTSASNYFERSAKFKLALLRNDPDNVTIRTDLADTRSWQSNIHAKEGKLFLAISDLRQALVQIEKIYTIKSSFKLIERMANLQHKVALLYYDSGDLANAEHFAKKAKENMSRLIINDNKNLNFKTDLIWNHLLSVQIMINQQNIDKALVYIDKTKQLISKIQNSSSMNKKTKRANTYMLQQQARIMAMLKQKHSAIGLINDSIKLFNNYLSVNTDTAFYSRIVLTRLSLLSNFKVESDSVIKVEFKALLSLLENKLHSNPKDYHLLSIYIATINFSKKVHFSKPFQINKQWLQHYQNSDYNIPDYSIISLMDSQ